MRHMTVRQALQHVADNPVMATDEVVQVPVYELVSRQLFEIANRPDASVRGSMTRANKARAIILDRMTGKRQAGTDPAAKVEVELTIMDLSNGAIE